MAVDRHEFARTEIDDILARVKGQTLGAVDKKNVFAKTEEAKKITGIAGDVIEISVLGYSSNSSREPDLVVDGVPVELKTIGVRHSSRGTGPFEAKEPMTITAVSLPKDGSEPHIIRENFRESHFWKKAENLLIVVYLYMADGTVPAKDYASFPIQGHLFITFNDEDKERLENDWKIIQAAVQKAYHSADREAEYSKLSSKVRPQLAYLDIAPRYPNPPRFRLKRAFVSKIVQENFPSGGTPPQHLQGYRSMSDFDRRCAQIRRSYAGMSLGEILGRFGIAGAASKNAAEQAVVRMFGGERKKLNELEVFSSFGVIAKTITLTTEGKNTEDMKLFTINFKEFKDSQQDFEDSTAYSYFADHQFVFIVFEEPYPGAPLEENILKGFKRGVFTDKFIKEVVQKTWGKIAELVLQHKLMEIPEFTADHKPIINRKTGKQRMTLNFPKSRDNIVFVRGTGTDSDDKREEVNGIRMYPQQLWIKGSWIAEELKHLAYL